MLKQRGSFGFYVALFAKDWEPPTPPRHWGEEEQECLDSSVSSRAASGAFPWYRIVASRIAGYKLKIAQLFSKTGVGSVFYIMEQNGDSSCLYS